MVSTEHWHGVGMDGVTVLHALPMDARTAHFRLEGIDFLLWHYRVVAAWSGNTRSLLFLS
jgi:hypothetical protein